MIIKKFQAQTEKDAIMLAKEELGSEAIVMNIKTMAPKGIFKLFRKTVVEVTAAVDDSPKPIVQENPMERAIEKAMEKKEERQVNDLKVSDNAADDTSAIEQKLNSLQSMLEKQLSEEKNIKTEIPAVINDVKQEEESKSAACVQLIYNQLTANEVTEKNAKQIISEIDTSIKNDVGVDNILSAVYQKIVLKLGQAETLELTEGKTKYVFFIGPTGVGKTTTIAKLASTLKLGKKAKIALLTADTYRIAAVEQLRSYANILGIPISVIYSEEEMPEVIEEYKDYDIVLVDTAGRSHKCLEQRDDIERLINSVPEADRIVYLVLSATTKYNDLVKITESYSEIVDYKLLFTKLDETCCIGNIFNIRMLTNAPLSYSTCGQNVPDDIDVINPQSIAKQLLGGN